MPRVPVYYPYVGGNMYPIWMLLGQPKAQSFCVSIYIGAKYSIPAHFYPILHAEAKDCRPMSAMLDWTKHAIDSLLRSHDPCYHNP